MSQQLEGTQGVEANVEKLFDSEEIPLDQQKAPSLERPARATVPVDPRSLENIASQVV